MRQSVNFALVLVVSLAPPLDAQLPAVPRPTPLLAVPRPTPLPFGAPASAADSLALTIAIFRAATAHGTRRAHAAPLPRLVCLVRGRTWTLDPPAEVVAALQRIDTLLVRPMSACRPEPGPRRTAILADRITGRRGISIWASAPRFTRGDGSFEVDLGYGEHELSAALWKCTGRKRDGKWEVTACNVTIQA